jgi:hypothetical protein
MDWKQFFAAIVTALAWPSAVVIVVILLRSPLTKLIPRVRSLKYKDLHIDLADKLEAVKEKLEAETESDPPRRPFVALPGVLELARIDPRAAIISAWIEVERATIEMALKAGIAITGTALSIANHLHALDCLSEFEFETFRNLRRVRNDAVHLTTKDVTFDEAVSMADMCQWLADRIRMLTAGIPKREPSEPLPKMSAPSKKE